MDKITLNAIGRKRRETPRRRDFSQHSGFKQNDDKYHAFSVPFAETILPIFEAKTGLRLFYSKEHKNYWRSVSVDNDEEIEVINNWIKKQGSRVFLRDCLALSLALGHNLEDNTSGQYTLLGELEHNAKIDKDIASADELAEYAIEAIQDLPFYKDADYVCAPPARTGKDFDLPNHIVDKVSNATNKPDITKYFAYTHERDEIKEAGFEEKWDIWEASGLIYNQNEFDVRDKNIILIDDKYQSGITLHYVAMKLQEAGANNVYGLCMVKTLKDTDNK